MSKFVLHYELDKGQYFDPETSFNQSCFPNKKADDGWESTCLYNLLSSSPDGRVGYVVAVKLQITKLVPYNLVYMRVMINKGH